MKKWFYSNYYYLEQPVKFRLLKKEVDTFFRAIWELFKIFLIKFGIMKITLTERLFERSFAITQLPKKNQLKILDLGCADSIFPLELASLGHEVWGSDPKNYAFAKKINFVKGDFIKEKNKFFKNYFDVITCISAIEHFGFELSLGEKIKAFEENRKDIEAISICRSLLKKDGVLILTVPYGKNKRLGRQERIYNEEELKKLTKGFLLIHKKIVNSKNELTNDEVEHESIFMGVFKKEK